MQKKKFAKNEFMKLIEMKLTTNAQIIFLLLSHLINLKSTANCSLDGR